MTLSNHARGWSLREEAAVPITMSCNLTADGTTTPVVSTEIVIHLPEEIVAAVRQADRDGRAVVICCRGAEQAAQLAERLLAAGLGSGVLTGQARGEQVRATVEAFGYGDFTALLCTDDLYYPWKVSDAILLHADLPVPHGSLQLMTAINARRSRVSTAVAA